jgi:hypothetical protein
VAFGKEEVEFSSGWAEFVLFKGVVVLIGEIVYAIGSGIEWFAGHIVATGICMIVIGNVFVVPFSSIGSVKLPVGFAVGARIGATVITLPGTMACDGSRSVGIGPSALEIICIPAKGP